MPRRLTVLSVGWTLAALLPNWARFRGPGHTLYRFIVGTILVLCFSPCAMADGGGHSHFRFGHISWALLTPTGSNKTEIMFTAAFRRNGYECRAAPSTSIAPCKEPDDFPGVGDYFLETIGDTTLNFGDGSPETPVLLFRVIAFSATDNWVLARALNPGTNEEGVPHSYPGSGPFTVFIQSCCRILEQAEPNAHINNPGSDYRVEAVINFAENNTGNPKSLLPPIVDCPQNALCRFAVAATDPDDPENKLKRIHWRFSESIEAAPSFGFTQPPGATINPDTGLYEWNTAGAELGPAGFQTLYSTQVTIEELDSTTGKVLLSKSAVDFFIRLVPLEKAKETVKIPVRWCALVGDPNSTDKTAMQNLLLQRLDLINSNIFGPQTVIQFRSGAVGSMSAFPLIKDTVRVPNDEPGDVLYVKGDPLDELNSVVAECRKKWGESAPHVTGIIAVQIHQFVGKDGKPASAAGLAFQTFFSNTAVQVLDGYAMVQDIRLDSSFFNQVKVLGQELAHALSLFHGDGVNDDDDKDKDKNERIDEDPEGDDDGDGQDDDDGDGQKDEDGPGTEAKHNLMGYGNGCNKHGLLDLPFCPHHFKLILNKAIELTKLQADRIRDQAILHIPDRGFSSGVPPLGNARIDEIRDVPAGEEFIDISVVGVSVDQLLGITKLALSVVGVVPNDGAHLNYAFLSDTDNSAATGDSQTSLSTTSSLQGVDLIGQVSVTSVSGRIQLSSTLKKFDPVTGDFVDLVDPRIQARVLPRMIALIRVPDSTDSGPSLVQQGSIITLEFPSSLIGPMAQDIRVEARAENQNTGASDGSLVELTFRVPVFPSCKANPEALVRGGKVSINASGLPPSTRSNVFLSGGLMASGDTDAAGTAIIDIVVPQDALTGLQPIRVSPDGSAVTADCAVSIQATPEFDVPPSPQVGAVISVRAGRTLVFQVQASDADTEDQLTVEAIGLPIGASFPTPGPENPITGTFTWTPVTGQEGDHLVVFTARDSRGLSAPPHTVTIRVVVNRTPLANAGPDQTISGTAASGTSVVLDGSGSSDADGDQLSFRWTGPFPEGNGVITGPRTTVTLPFGTSTVTLVVNDGLADSVADTVSITVTGFAVGVVGASALSVPAGLDAIYSIRVSPLGGLTGQVALSCSGNPELSTCTITPTSGTLGTQGFTATVTISTRAGTVAQLAAPPQLGALRVVLAVLFGMLALAMLAGMARAARQRTWRGAMVRFAALVVWAALAWGCVGNTGTPPGTYTITVTATAGSLTHTTTFQLTVR